jgi:hypothetical protein
MRAATGPKRIAIVQGHPGFAPIHATLIGSVEAMSNASRTRWLKKLASLGRAVA